MSKIESMSTGVPEAMSRRSRDTLTQSFGRDRFADALQANVDRDEPLGAELVAIAPPLPPQTPEEPRGDAMSFAEGTRVGAPPSSAESVAPERTTASAPEAQRADAEPAEAVRDEQPVGRADARSEAASEETTAHEGHEPTDSTEGCSRIWPDRSPQGLVSRSSRRAAA